MSYTLPPLRKARLQRSELAVPGSNPTMIEKAAQSAADYIFLDCEDAVAPPDKEQARKNMAMFEQALSMWSPFSGVQGGPKRPGQPPGPAGEKAAAAEPAKKEPNDISELKAQLANMQQKIDKLSEDRD